MTIVTIDIKEATSSIYFHPTLPPAKGVQLIYTVHLSTSWGIFCDIVDPLSSYTDFGGKEFGPSQLLYIVPSSFNEPPVVGTKKSDDPISTIKLIIMDEKGNLIKDHNLTRSIVCLKIYH